MNETKIEYVESGSKIESKQTEYSLVCEIWVAWVISTSANLMQILALADKSPATVQFSRLRTLAERKRDEHFERTRVTDQQDESAC